MKEYLKYISSNIMAMIGTSLYVLADTYFIALGVGSTGLTALNLALPFFNVMSATGMMFGVGGSTRYKLAAKTPWLAAGMKATFFKFR